ncbi:hypothetical protein [Pedobacter gandavensis]|uniref:hypothetical protein n=1 Tax=Pedobacter gandavensis TaxID=2679963 RepID=UPI00292DCDE6|nr:hypothetical protein [Pedobacter gandavensis]
MRFIPGCCIIFIILFCNQTFGQAGMTLSPGKLYFKLPPGATTTRKIMVSNPIDKEIEVGVSMSDWDYDLYGNNQTYEPGSLKNSCANWLQVLPGSYFTLRPGEQRELDVVLKVPADANTTIPVHTAMVFLTQLNPGDSKTASGAQIKVSVRMGVKIYHSFIQNEEKSLEVLNFTDKLDSTQKELPGILVLEVENNGKIWLDSKIKWEMLNMQTGEKKKLEELEFFTLPGDKRIIQQKLPSDLKKGRYNATAIINYGNKDELKVVELEFVR